MQLTHIHIDHLKSLRGVQLAVPQLLAVAGPNGAGKTSILQAVRLGVLGHDPAVGRKLEATRLLAGAGGDIDVGLTFANGFGIHRSFGASTRTDVAPPRGERTEKEKQERISAETGAFVPSFDLDAFLALSAEKRREMLFGLLPRERVGLTVEVWRQWLGYAAEEESVQRAIDRLWTERVLQEQSPLEGLASAMRYAHAKFLEAEAERQAQVKVVDAADRDAGAASTMVVEYDAAAAERLQAEQEALAARRAQITARIDEYDRAQRRQRERAHRVRVLDIRRQQVDEQRQQAAAALAQTTAAPEAEAAVRRALEEAERRARAQREAVTYTAEQLQAATAAMAHLRYRSGALDGATACPTCGSQTDLEAVRAELAAQLGEASAARAKWEDERRGAERRQQELDAAAAERRRELDAVLQAAQRRAALETEVEQLTRERNSIDEERAAFAAVGDEYLADPGAVELDWIDAAMQRVRDALRQQQETARLAGRAEAERARADRERRELEKRTARAAALKRLHVALQKLRAHVIEQLVAPVEATANEILQAIDPDKRFAFVFEREGRDTFDFGFEEASVFRSYDAASTGEDAFLAVVFVAALIAAVQPAWRVLMVDNVESLDDERRRLLMVALARPEVRARFGNVILAGCCWFGDIDGWTVVDARELGHAAVAAEAA